MPIYVKELIVAFGLGALVLRLSRPCALLFTDAQDFKRRSGIWLLLTATAFLSPSFWVFVLVGAPLLYWGGKRDSNPLAFYLFLMSVIPSIPIEIPAIGIQHLFDLDIFELLSLCVLVPAAWRARNSSDSARNPGMKGIDALLLGYGALQVALFIPPDLPNHVILHNSATNVLRASFLFLTSAYILYYAASRTLASRRAIADALCAYVISCGIMAAVAVFESVKHWLLYTTLNARWGGNALVNQYVFRAGLLRAEAASGNPLVLGYMLAIAFGFWLYLQSHVPSRRTRIAGTVLLWAGLLVSFSRGPWLGAVAIYFAYAAMGPRGASRLFRSTVVFVAISAIILASPLGARITEVLPFMGGKVDQGSISYREKLVERSLQLIQEHPLLGDQRAYSRMQDLRQGQGIIDIVNTYLDVTLFYGLTGLTLFLAFILSALIAARRAARQLRGSDDDGVLLGAALIACILGTLLMLADCSFILAYPILFYTLAGLAAAYARVFVAPHRSAVADFSDQKTLEHR